MPNGLAALADQVRRDLTLTQHPNTAWMPPKTGPDGKPMLDVLIAGAGQGGLAVAHQLKRDRVDNLLVIDRAAYGREGVWTTYARMHTLRSPKDYTGPDLGLPSLTYIAWHQAKYGEAHWQDLGLIDKDDWNDYLLWYRRVLDLPVQNETALVGIAPAGAEPDSGLCLTLATPAGQHTIYARKLVLATGQDGTGRWWMPDFVSRLPVHLRAHAADEIDFASLKGKRVAVLGAGASAADNAACALEAGAATVTMYVRRQKMQRIQPYRWLTFAGFLKHVRDLPDEWRWRFMAHIQGLRESIPQNTYDRMRRHSNFAIRMGCPWLDAQAAGDCAIIATPDGPIEADFIICGTGIAVDFALRPELASFADKIATWSDRYTPPAAEADERLGQFAYLDPDGAFSEKSPGDAPWLSHIFDFTMGATISLGPSGCSINGMKAAVPLLAAGITRGLFRADAAHHWRRLLDYDTPVFTPASDDQLVTDGGL
jgi:cation diffusion facilitator CzcD-associated flavoprotein CzcO